MKSSTVSPVQATGPHLNRLRRLQELPGPRGLPLLGNALELEPTELHRLVSRWADHYGQMFAFKVATQRIVVVADPETIQSMLRERPGLFRRWRKLETIATDIKADGLFTAEGTDWRRQRKFVMYALNAGHVREFIPRLEEVTGRLRRRWWQAALAGTPVDVRGDLMRFTVDVTSGLAFGRDINTLEEQTDPIQNHLDKIFPAVARWLPAPFPYWRYLKSAADRETADAVEKVGKLIDALIAETRERLAASLELRAKPTNLLEALVAAHDSDEGGPSDEEIAANVMTMLLAGEDTTANSIAYMIHFLKEYPQVQAAVQEEVDRVFGMTEQPWEDPGTADKLRYIEAFANESLRCKPVAGYVLFLEPNEDMQIQDVFVPKGTPVFALTGYPGTQEANFEDAKAFRPERWLQPVEPAGCPHSAGSNNSGSHNSASHNTRAFMPFGSGPRFCPGRQLAMLQIKMVISMLCRDFEVRHQQDAPALQDAYNFTVGPTNVSAVLHPRRPVRRGTDIELRIGERRSLVIPIAFSERRIHGRRSADAASRRHAAEQRARERRALALPISFPERRAGERRRQHTALVG